MIGELGQLVLCFALALSLVMAVSGLMGARPTAFAARRTATSSALGLLVFVVLAFGILTYAFVISDFSVMLVANHSHTLKPLIYKISGVWANHEGSMLLWIFILALFGAAVAVFGRNLPPGLRGRVLAVQAMIGSGFLLFILLTSNPFQRQFPVPA